MSTPRFFYHAYAIPLSGTIRRPVVKNIDGHATSALSRYGGHSSAHEPPYMLSSLVSHAGASSHVSGVYVEATGRHETVAEATVRGFDLEGVLRVEMLQSGVQASHIAFAEGDPAITIKGSVLQGLSIHGQPIELESWIDIFNRLDTLDKLREYYRENAEFREAINEVAYVGRAKDLPEKVARFFPWRYTKPTDELPMHRNMTILPVFRIKTSSTDRFKVYGNVIQIENFGRVQLGELMVEWNHRRLMMMHAALGSPCDGDLTGGCSGGNGTGGPPPPPDGGG